MELKLDFNDVLIVPKKSNQTSRLNVNLTSTKLSQILNIETNGIIAANMDGVGTLEMCRALVKHKSLTALSKHYPNEVLIDFLINDPAAKYAFFTFGLNDDQKIMDFIVQIQKNFHLYENTINYPLKICLDVANGYLLHFVDFCKKIRNVCDSHKIPVIIMAGNVVDFNGALELYKNGVNIIKIGIGSGSNCLTRTQTGVGYPQFSAVFDIATHNDNIYSDLIICSDGGCTTPGDIAKALCAGAHMVMLGGMLSGSTEGFDGKMIDDNVQDVIFYGMSSITAQKKHSGEHKQYRSSEGRTTKVKYKGSIEPIILDILGGIRSTCTYINSSEIDEMSKNAKFIRVNNVINKVMEHNTIGN